MCKIIAIANQKGGVGKTTTTSNLGIGLAKQGKRVLLIDADAQGSLTASLGFTEPDRLEETLATVMANIINEVEMDADYGILKHEEGIDLMPGNIELSGLEVSMANVMSRELVMRSYIELVKDSYDYILIDCMPSLGMITINAFACADSILIPVQAAYLPVKGLEQLIKTIGKVKRQINPRLEIEGILLTMVDSRTNYAKDITTLLIENYGSKVKIFENSIPISYHSISDEQKSMFGGNQNAQEALGKCSKCGGDVVKGKYGAYCKNKCGMNAGRAMRTVLSDSQIKSMLAGKKTLVKGIKGKNGLYDAYLIPEGVEDYCYTKDGKEIKGTQYKVRLEFPKSQKN